MTYDDLSALPDELAQARKNPGLAVLEGFHALKHALRFGAQILRVVAVDPAKLEAMTGEFAPDLSGYFIRTAVPVPPELFRRLSRNGVHTEVITIARRPAAGAELDPAKPVVFLEDPRNLGNLGAVIRVAAAADAAAVFTSGLHDPWDPAAIRGSAGLHYALPVARIAEPVFPGRVVVAVDPDGDELRPEAVPDGAVLAFGTEREGLSAALLERADLAVRIPMRPGVSSLNLATSVAVMLYARVRSR
ncbi:TrmH family RNA methyltransferase [Actinoplanes sp. NPDC051494]|uniref:TrmH family RNA methyltransferase n=1 Tax=Actinoplanes sp. NPDC051494 TaxID=3363907 RepID=UPI0037BB8E8E